LITLADIPLLVPDGDGELVRWMNRYMPIEDLQIACDDPVAVASPRTDGRTGVRAHTGLPRPNWPAPPRPRLNSLYWPTGATRWARGYFLATEEAKDQIVAAAGNESSGQMTKIKLKMGDQGEDDDPEDHRWILEADVWVLPPRPISSLDAGQQSGDYEETTLWLIPVVDDRYFWQYRNVDDFSVTTSTTWANLIDTLETALGLSSPIDHDTVDVEYLNPDPIEFTRRRDNAAVLLDAVAFSVNQRVVRQLDGSVTMRNYGNASADLDENLNREWRFAAGAIFSSHHGGIPAKTLMTFPEYIDRIIKQGGELRTKENDAPNGTKGTASSRRKVVHSTCYADMPIAGGSTPDNDSKLSGLASQWNTDYYGWLDKKFDMTFVGMFEWEGTGYDDAVLWEFGTPLGDGGSRKATTRVWSLPQNFGVETQLSQDPDLTPLFGVQFGRLDETLAPEGSATFSIYEHDDAASPVWDDTNLDVTVHENNSGDTHSSGAKGMAVPHKLKNKWIFVPFDFEQSSDVVVFELLTPLAPKGSATAFLETYDPLTGGYVSSELIVVHDAQFTSSGPSPLEPYSDMFVGPAGCRGTAVFRNTVSGMRHFNIVWMARLARFIYVAAYGDYDVQNQTIVCRVTGYWDQGYRPVADEQSPVTVHDPLNMFHRSGVGLLDDLDCVGIAVYRGDLNRYDLLWMEQISMLYTAKLAADMLGDTATIELNSQEGPRPMGWSLYVHQQEPFPSLIPNPRKLYGEKGDEIVIAVHDYRDKFEVLAVTARPTWGWAKLNGPLPKLGSVTAKRWIDTPAGMVEMTPAQNLLIHDRMLDAELPANTRITWEFDPIVKRYYLRTHACAADSSSQGWGT